ncbi:LysR substrate-binding domain-containing protein [Ensifer sp. YR511]|uniref:LysR substrate-binding domain-containing protein n=1 Tax=Ensifer sp. YR511 TaxID=1855294 RepID=UPI00088001FC|nr:LysR substrate-binding domain-containing protein [Ensifer sp. YR511]SDN42799.1 DNA-binding transcriptional regulator, LysR family [Ensifer sp. YR511]
MQRITLRMLNYVEAAARLGNVTEAAKEKNVSQSSVSLAIAELEAFVGAPLFIRHHAKGVDLTPAGAGLILQARHLLNHAQDFEKHAMGLSDGLRGEVTVGCFVTLAARFMPKLLASFSQTYPGITVRLEEGSQDAIVDMIMSGRVELGLSYHSALRQEISAQHLGELPPHVLLSMDHKFAKRQSVSLRELAAENFILLDLPFSRDYFLNLFRRIDAEPRIVFRSQSPELIRGLVANGHGFTIHNAVSSRMVANDGMPLAVLRIEEELPGARVTCLQLEQTALRPAVDTFRRYLTAAFSTGGLFADSLRSRQDRP